MTNRETPPPIRPRRRPRLQFSLQTMIVLLILSGLLCAVLLRPRFEEETWAGGALKIRAERRPRPATANATVDPDQTDAFNGRWILYDRYDRKLAEGAYREDQPSGSWKYYDGRGRVVLSGQATAGDRSGRWRAVDRADQTVVQVNLTRAAYQDYYSVNGWGPSQPETRYIPHRNGPATSTGKGGQLLAHGEYRDDRRHGPWEFFDESGRLTDAGSYVNGLKQGEWTHWTGPDRTETSTYFDHGQAIRDLQGTVHRLETELRSSDRRRKTLAAWRLESLGEAALPVYRRVLADGELAETLLVVRGLLHLGTRAQPAAGELKKLDKHGDLQVRFAAQVAMAEIEPDRAASLYERLVETAVGGSLEQAEQARGALLRAGPVGLSQIAQALDSTHQKSGILAVDLLFALRRVHELESPNCGGPNVSADDVARVLDLAKEHENPWVREAYEKQADRRNRWITGCCIF